MPSANTQVSLGELIRLAFPSGTPLPAAGMRERPVKWVVMDGSGIEPDAGDFLLCNEAPTKKAAANWAHLGVAGLALPHGVTPPNGVEIPVIVLPSRASMREIQKSALELIVNRQSYLFQHGAKMYQTLAALSLEGGGLLALAQTMRDQTGKTVVIQDKRLEFLAEAVAPGKNPLPSDVKAAMGAFNQLPEGLRDRRQAAAVAGWRDQSLPNGMVRLVCPIVAKGMARGYVSIVGAMGEIDALDQLVIEHGAAACALEMAKAKAVSEAEKRAYGDFVDAVLTGAVSLDELVRWAQRIGYDVMPPHAASVWRWANEQNAPSLRRLETLINQSVAKEGVNALVRLRGNEVIVFCAVADASRPNTALDFTQVVLKAASDEYPHQPLFAGIGRPALDLPDWKDSYREGLQAFSMATRLNEHTPLYFGDLSVYRLLFQLEGNPELEAFCKEALGPLIDYEGGGDLLETLEAFCDKLGNLSQTAEKLFIHRNSLLYRMERIGQIAGIDMNNPDTRLAVHLALKVRKMIRPPGKKPKFGAG